MSQIHSRTLFSSPLVTIRDVHCSAPRSGCGAEEISSVPGIAFLRRGLFVTHVHGARVVADANQAVFFNPTDAYRVSHPLDGGDECTVFEFEPGLLIEMLREAGLPASDHVERPFAAPHATLTSPAQIFQRRLHRLALRNGAVPTAIEEQAMQLLADPGVLTPARPARAGRMASARRRARQVEAVKLELSANLGSQLSLAELARAVHCSPFHLARLFREHTGMPIHRYQLQLRLTAALDRLAQGCTNLTDLALEVGFAGHSHFTNTFRRVFGVSPANFRRELANVPLR